MDHGIGFEPYEVWEDPNASLAPDELIVTHGTGLLGAGKAQLACKRALDITLGSLMIVILSPLLLLIAGLVKVTSRGPVFFVQRRVGKDGRPFSMLKFRSMCHDAHERRAEHESLNLHTGPIFKAKADPRITGVGRFIRRMSIDELPQLLNVLLGNMSLVGPRPCLPEEFTAYDERERQRVLVKPGLTCIWQVSGRSNLSFDTWVAMDLNYISTWSFWLDLKLLFLTLPAVFSRRGAY
jgi:lipopolysaccharide/colanic/teichoic acid biosynthesis glycosyltransferase